MREIKFDAIYKPTGEHFEPYNIDFRFNTLHGRFDGSDNDWCHFSLDGNKGDAILREYTGLKDKNGKEIYEGDNLKINPYVDEEHTVLVVFENGAFVIDTPFTYEYDQTVLGCYINEFGNHTVEIISNIYEGTTP